jgi:hypothetical protein
MRLQLGREQYWGEPGYWISIGGETFMETACYITSRFTVTVSNRLQHSS